MPPTRLTLASLTLPQKLLVLVILGTVGSGYLAALANTFAQVAGSDGRQSVTLADFPSVAKERGLAALAGEIERSLGKEDVVRRYHGLGSGVTRLQAALDGTMKPKILEELTKGTTGDEATIKLAEELRQMLIDWSRLDRPLREQAYRAGVPVTADGAANLVKFQELATRKAKMPKVEPVIAHTLRDYCVTCHSPGGDPQARTMPLETFEQVDAYCTEDHGMSLPQLAMTTHVHLLGFAVLFAMTGFLFSLTSYPEWVRILFVPWTLLFQMMEIACWWLAKTQVVFAAAIFYLGGIVGIGLLIQIVGVLWDLVRPRAPTT